MLTLLTIIGIIIILIAAIPYIIYLLGIYFGKKINNTDLFRDIIYPDISIVVCAYNEERNIAKKIQSISSCSYPKDKIELILIIDSSSDNTEKIARNELNNVNFNWKISMNKKRCGKNKSLNKGIEISSNNIVISTDADLIWNKYSAEILVRDILSDKSFAAGTGDLQPNPGIDKITSMEKSYRSFFGRMAEWESAHDSTYAFNGCLLIMRKDMINSVNEKKGADDANLAFEAIKSGHRTFYDSRAVIYEELPDNLKKQYTQKVRRAKGLIQTTIMNRNLLKFNRPFSKIFYPLRIWMFIFTPTMLLIGGIIFSIGMLLTLPLIYAILVTIIIILSLVIKSNLITSFIINQFYLLAGLYSRRKDAVIWQSTSKKVGE